MAVKTKLRRQQFAISIKLIYMNMWSTPWVDRRLNCAKHVVPAVVSCITAKALESLI